MCLYAYIIYVNINAIIWGVMGRILAFGEPPCLASSHQGAPPPSNTGTFRLSSSFKEFDLRLGRLTWKAFFF